MPKVFTWSCSIYKNSEKSWLYGNLQLYENGLSFQESEQQKNRTSGTTSAEVFKVSFSYDSISVIRKASSKVVFSCVVLRVSGEDIWLSSFINRDMVFATIDHFWRDQLFGYGGGRSREISANRNQDLIKIAYNTQNSLMDAGRTLHMQGNQLKHTAQTMNELHNDLTVAERLTGDIDSWFGAWRIKTKMKRKKDIHQQFESALNMEKIEYPALIARSTKETHNDGYLIMRNNTIDFTNKKSEILQTFLISEITQFNVHSPWDITIRKRNIGKADVTLHIISKQLPSILQTFEKVYKCDLDYDDPPNSTEYDASDEIEMDYRIALIGKNKSTVEPSQSTASQSGQQTVKQHDLCEEDAREVMSVLKNIKTLALDVGTELDTQNQQIDVLDASVDRANVRLKSADWKVKKLT